MGQNDGEGRQGDQNLTTKYARYTKKNPYSGGLSSFGLIFLPPFLNLGFLGHRQRQSRTV